MNDYATGARLESSVRRALAMHGISGDLWADDWLTAGTDLEEDLITQVWLDLPYRPGSSAERDRVSRWIRAAVLSRSKTPVAAPSQRRAAARDKLARERRKGAA